MNSTMSELKERMLLQQYLKKAEKQNKPTYSTFLKKKMNGEEVSIDALSREELEALYLNEGLVDKQIAFLVNGKGIDIQKKRTQWGIQNKLSYVS